MGEIIDMGVEAKILDKSGAWYAYNGEKIGQRPRQHPQFLKENPALAAEIETKCAHTWAWPRRWCGSSRRRCRRKTRQTDQSQKRRGR